MISCVGEDEVEPAYVGDLAFVGEGECELACEGEERVELACVGEGERELACGGKDRVELAFR